MANVIEIILHATDAATANINRVTAQIGGLESAVSGFAAFLGGPVGIAVMAAGAATSVGLLVNRLSDEVEMLENLHRETGFAINDLRILRRVLEEAGKSPDSLNNALFLLNKNLATGKKSLVDMVGDTKDPMEALIILSQRVAGGANAAKVAFDAFGRGGRDLAAILVDVAARYGDVKNRLGELDEATIRAAGSFDRLMDRMGTAIKRFLDGVAAKLLKFLDDMARKSTGMTGMIARALGFGEEEPQRVKSTIDNEETGPSGASSYDPEEAFRLTQEMQRKRLEQFRRDNAEIVTVTESLIGGLTLSIDSVFSNLFSKFQTFGSAIKTLFEGVAQSITSALAKIATSKLLIWISGFLLPGTGSGILQGLGGIIREAGKGLVGSNSLSMAGAGGNTYVINTLDTGTLRAAMQPGGSWNRASDVVRIGSRY